MANKWFGKPEKEVDERIQKHIKAVGNSLKAFRLAYSTYIEGDIDGMLEQTRRVHRMETKADGLLREIEHLLHEGAFMSVVRGDMALLVESLDYIANSAERAADTLALEKPEIPEPLQPMFAELVKRSTYTFDPFKEIGSLLKTEYGLLVAIARQVEAAESDVDKIEWDLTSEMFKMDLDLAHKNQLRFFIHSIAKISDACEDASDRLELLILKRQV